MNEEQIKEIETKSRNQTHDHIWKAERRHRLTSSVFGKVMSRRPTNVSSCLVKNLLYTNFKGNINTIRGLAEEDHTVTEYKNLKGNVDVRKVGLCISSEYPYLGTSPDGIVTENNQEGLIEIKNFLQNNRFTIKEAVKKVPNFCLEERDNELKLKQTNEIYYQIQGQLNILNKPWCDFVLRRTNPYDIHVERIYRNKQVWQEMVPKLSAFYYKFLLPELSHPRRNTVSGIRQPKSPWFIPPQQDSSTNANCQAAKQTKAKKNTRTLFVGRQIKHEWEVENGMKQVFTGTVVRAIKGKDGGVRTTYEVKYIDDDNTYEVKNLLKDLENGSLQLVNN